MRKIKINLSDSLFISFAIILISLICIFTLFIKPVIGIADNGDFYRIISQSGLYHLSKNDNDIFFGYFTRYYGIYKYYNENGMMLLSTQAILIRIALFLNKIFKDGYIFDIKYLAILYVITMDFAAYFIIKSLIINIELKRYKLLTILLFVLIFCDTGYIAYFNSFYGEAVNLSFFLLSIGLLLYIYTFNRITPRYLILFSTVSLIFIGSKQQLAPIGILYCLVLLRLLIITRDKHIKQTIKILTGTFLVSSAIFYFSIVGPFDYINRYHSMTRGVLLNEANPEEVLSEFRISSQYSILAGNIFYKSMPVIDPNDNKLMNEFYSKYSFGSILKYYTKNPRAFSKIMSIASENAYSIKPDVMGNYEKSTGKSFGEKSSFFSLYSNFKIKYLPHNIGFTIFLIVIYFIFAINDYISYRNRKDTKGQLIEEVFLFVFLVGGSQVLVSVVGAGDADISKHLFMFNVSFDLMVYFSAIRLLRHQKQ
ncbi:hypothetical protein [Clostridium folliculivorans]|uniref:Membrane protein n=1 Tax=Clostridium folliculivorans TaxID=2886038 RepID=A0A9W5Y3W5_9CLOT|nr:hypothetical protein [Clostridium folliculivorans]GKU26171.1 membrane protein [Clostridium folliculivorans]GKU31843.1 membrane protein [Clostridium folliculivorans]